MGEAGSILIGLIPALGWGFQGIVMQKIGGTTANKQMGMVLTALAVSIVIAFFVILFWQGCKLTQRATFQHSTTTGITVAYIMVSIPISAALSIIFTLEHLVHEILGLRRDSTDRSVGND